MEAMHANFSRLTDKQIKYQRFNRKCERMREGSGSDAGHGCGGDVVADGHDSVLQSVVFQRPDGFVFD